MSYEPKLTVSGEKKPVAEVKEVKEAVKAPKKKEKK